MISVISTSPLRSGEARAVANIENDQPSNLRTLSAVREQVAQEIAMRTVNKAQVVDDVQTNVSFTFSSKRSSDADLDFLKLIASQISRFTASKDKDYIYLVATSGLPPPNVPYNFILICASGDDYIQRAVAIISSKFVGRVDKVRSITPEASVVEVREVGLSSYDELALWDAVRKSARAPIDPLVPPPGSRSAERMLSDARAHLQRLTPKRAYEELRDPVEDGVQAPTFLVDIREERERCREGSIKGALVVGRNELEWKFDPMAPKEERLGVVDRYDLRVIVFDGDGRASSLAAYQLRELGMWNATDIVGGFGAWKKAGFPVQPEELGQGRNELLVNLDLV